MHDITLNEISHGTLEISCTCRRHHFRTTHVTQQDTDRTSSGLHVRLPVPQPGTWRTQHDNGRGMCQGHSTTCSLCVSLPARRACCMDTLLYGWMCVWFCVDLRHGFMPVMSIHLMLMRVCMQVCMHVCVYVCKNSCTYVCVYECMTPPGPLPLPWKVPDPSPRAWDRALAG